MQDLDRPLFLSIVILTLFGLVMVYSAGAAIGVQRFADPLHYLYRQARWLFLGGLLFALAVRTDYRRWERWVWVFFLVSTALLVAVLIPGVGVEANGARRWLRIAGLTMQPAEVAKLAAVALLAHNLPGRGECLRDFRNGLLPQLIVVGIPAFLIYREPDLGGTMVMATVAMVLFYLAGARLSHLALLVVAVLPVVLWKVVDIDYRVRRLAAFLDPWADPTDTGWQITQSLMALGSGGLAGHGLSSGVQKLYFLPEPHTDFIFSVVGEELGLLGTLGVAACFLLFAWRGLRVAVRAPTPFGQFLAAGIVVLITLQALLNMMVCTSLVPTKGLPLPFVSYGGTSLVLNLVAAGVLLNISRWVTGK
ncbi:MAG TPA: putative lipid II flippase FtsW [bacterium]|jgi:cell division protein FtsW